ncbi:MAG: sulfite exporter TauE/SafE family protein [Pseudomonadales bacterium]|nr:sulfite exporter TauE/SafE family protein [Pseudomonadales bacterium]MCP5213776.1 sulfite exporter TauE/SafE family protein [Pseudomonadales bacterium]
MTILLTYLALGAAAGTIAGLFGLGGGIIIVPALVIAFQSQGISAELIMHMAIASSLATIVLTSLSSIYAHHQKQAIRWELFTWIALGILLGSWLGVQTAISLDGAVLQMIFGVFLLVVALIIGFNIAPDRGRSMPGKPGLSIAGIGIGWFSALLGIGGGTLSVPFFTWCNLRMQSAVALAAACGLPIALMGTLANMYEGWGISVLPPYSAGYIYLPAVAAIAITSVPFARIGAKLAHRLPARQLKQAFALVLVAVGIKFIL